MKICPTPGCGIPIPSEWRHCEKHGRDASALAKAWRAAHPKEVEAYNAKRRKSRVPKAGFLGMAISYQRPGSRRGTFAENSVRGEISE